MTESNNIQVNGYRNVVIKGDVSNSTIITGDQHIILEGYTSEQLRDTLVALTRSLISGKAKLIADPVQRRLQITADDLPGILLSAQAAGALTETAKNETSERAYLSALCVNPRFGGWASQFVPLAGALTKLIAVPGWTEIPPEFTLLKITGKGDRKTIERSRLKDITEATKAEEVEGKLVIQKTLVILGEPGAGKTTTLHKLTLDAANKRLTTNTGKLPLFVSLANYRDYPSPFEFLETSWKQVRGQGDFGNALQNGELLILLDALNEMPYRDPPDYRAKVDAWRRFAQEYTSEMRFQEDISSNQFIFSCRSRDYSDPLGVATIEIERLDNEHVHEFLEKYLSPEQARDAWQRLEPSPLLDLVRNPYYLSMLAYLLKRDTIFPVNRAALFEGFVTVLLDRERRRDHVDWLGEEALSNALAELAFALQPLGEGTALPQVEIARKIPIQVAGKDGMVPTPAATVVRLGLAATLLDTEMSPDGQEHVRFYHHQLQEYFAAKQLLALWRNGEDHAVRWRMPRLKNEMPDPLLERWEVIPPPPGTGWEEPTIFAAGLARDEERAAFVEAVGNVNLILAARSLAEAGIPSTQVAMKKTQNYLLRAMTDPTLHLRYRIAAGDALGKLGDLRFQEIDANGTHVIMPPLIEIPAGPFWMGENKFRHRVDVQSFYIAQFSVTNAEFACFMQAGGYDDTHWWKTQEACEWLQQSTEHGPRFRNNTQYNNPSQPVVGVTWYEAMAYCAWLTEQLRIANLAQFPNSQFAICLPTEAEWEKAARGNSERIYPWGDQWDRERANTNESMTRRAVPVGMYPIGATPDQVHDLAGNVWEWTSSKHTNYPYQKDERENPEGNSIRVVRGGSFQINLFSTRCAFRFGFDPDLASVSLGLRLVLSPISDSVL